MATTSTLKVSAPKNASKGWTPQGKGVRSQNASTVRAALRKEPGRGKRM